MALFIVLYLKSDGGMYDRRVVLGYLKTEKTRKQLIEAQGHGFIDYVQLTEQQFLKKKQEAKNKLKMFDI